MHLKTQPALNFSIAALADLMNRAFTGYIGGDAHFPPAAFAAFLATDGTSLALSQVVLQNDE
ncbi:MAG: hypothetical protein GY796_21990, partial [Chloroflexi bacterium]|nr:hypothetical protein [Chloroflexota bacterium]